MIQNAIKKGKGKAQRIGNNMLKRVAVVLFIITVLLIIDVTKENEDAITITTT